MNNLTPTHNQSAIAVALANAEKQSGMHVVDGTKLLMQQLEESEDLVHDVEENKEEYQRSAHERVKITKQTVDRRLKLTFLIEEMSNIEGLPSPETETKLLELRQELSGINRAIDQLRQTDIKLYKAVKIQFLKLDITKVEKKEELSHDDLINLIERALVLEQFVDHDFQPHDNLPGFLFKKFAKHVRFYEYNKNHAPDVAKRIHQLVRKFNTTKSIGEIDNNFLLNPTNLAKNEEKTIKLLLKGEDIGAITFFWDDDELKFKPVKQCVDNQISNIAEQLEDEYTNINWQWVMNRINGEKLFIPRTNHIPGNNFQLVTSLIYKICDVIKEI